MITDEDPTIKLADATVGSPGGPILSNPTSHWLSMKINLQQWVGTGRRGEYSVWNIATDTLFQYQLTVLTFNVRGCTDYAQSVVGQVSKNIYVEYCSRWSAIISLTP